MYYPVKNKSGLELQRGLGSCEHLGEKWTFYRPPEGEAFVTAVASQEISSDTSGSVSKIWLGTNVGPAVFDVETKQWTQLTLPDTPENPLILSVFIQKGSVWFTGVEGVWQYSIVEKQMIRLTEGLEKPYVNVLVSAENTIWGWHSNRISKI